MTHSDKESSGRERLLEAYDRMMQRVKSAIEDAEDHVVPPLQRNISSARERAVELGELTKEEAEKIGAYLKRDLEDAGQYLARSGQEFGDWLRFDLETIENHMLELFASVADKTKLELMELEVDLREGPPYHAGEITGPGTLVCEECGKIATFHITAHIPPCSQCQGTVFRRAPDESTSED